MKNLDLSNRIKELRTQLGYSQAELADNARLSLRTVQRIESGEVKPRGYTLQSVAAALKISADELTEWEQKSDKLFLVILNLSALSFLMFPLLGVFVPLILWTMKKNEVKNARDMGKLILNFQITWCIVFCLVYLSFIIVELNNIKLGPGFTFNFTFYIRLFVALYILNLLSIIINAVRVQYEKPVKYFLVIPFLK